MPTTIPKVTVTRIETGNSFLITCTCGDTATRPFRQEADEIAAAHQRLHVTPDPADQVYL